MKEVCGDSVETGETERNFSFFFFLILGRKGVTLCEKDINFQCRRTLSPEALVKTKLEKTGGEKGLAAPPIGRKAASLWHLLTATASLSPQRPPGAGSHRHNVAEGCEL